MKRVIIFTCIGGHTTISQALQEYLHDTYQVTVVNIFLDVLWPIDFVRWLSCGFYSSEDFYSVMLQYQLLNLLAITSGTSFYYFNLCAPIMRYLIKRKIKQVHADAVISLIPFFNNHILAIAQELDIPFILMPTDIEIKTFIHKLPAVNYSKFHLALAFDDDTIRHNLMPLKLPATQVHITGAALKEGFFIPAQKIDIKHDLNIANDRPIVLLLMGSQGSVALVNFARKLATITTLPFHLIIVLGAHSRQYSIIEAINFPPNISTNIFAFTPRIAELMAISSLLITKAGGISISEAIYMNLPTILDATGSVLPWEQTNQAFMRKHQLSTIIRNLDDLPNMVTEFLTNAPFTHAYKERIMQFPKKHGGESIKRVLQMSLE